MGLESDAGAVVDRGVSSLQRGDLAQEQEDAEEGPEFLVGTELGSLTLSGFLLRTLEQAGGLTEALYWEGEVLTTQSRE